MKFTITFLVFSQCMLVVHSAAAVQKEYNFFPNLPSGEYRVHFKGLMTCALDGQIQFNLFLSKISRNAVELKGNVTQTVPFGDDFTLNIMMSVKDSIGGWKDNAFVYKAPKACTTIKNFLGSYWDTLLKDFGVKNTNCPIRPGVWVTKGYKLSNTMQETNFPKTFFYGTYKYKMFFTDANNSIQGGCIIFIVDVKRPWETD